ncbi:MAG: PD-(D/E)XK nuclease family protein [Bacteriovoracaceae bacterium]|nr:PD-(D/E)XK nuclease family protein [Bacteriovoracaceae bacterium]
MLDVVFYQSNQELIKKLRAKSCLVICPSPQIADNLRLQIPELEILTISKWITDHLKNKGLVRARKSELMIKLAAVWRHYFTTHPTSLFLQSFELFTELRSITLDLELLSEFFKELDEEMVKSILLFWTFLDQEKIIDEHLSYKKVGEVELAQNVVFTGFKHMSGVQIDMLRTLGENVEVAVTFPEAVYIESFSTDWIRWLSPDGVNKKNITKHEQELLVSMIPKGKANLAVGKFLNINPNYDLVLASSKVSLSDYQEVHKEMTFFKTSEDIFLTEKKMLISLLKNKISTMESLNAEGLNNFLELIKLDYAKSGEFKKYKLIQLFQEAIGLYFELSVGVDQFLIDILEIVIGLNSPRVSLMSLNKVVNHFILNVNDLSFKDEDKPVVFLATSSLSGFRSNEKILSENMSKALSAVGPLKRAGLEFQLYKSEILSVLDKKNTVLLIEEQVIESDIAWREILKSYSLASYDLGMNYSIKKIKEILRPKVMPGIYEQKFFSASKLQTYLDCPRKYYFTYIDKIENRPNERVNLGADELGQIEHKIIAQYFIIKSVSDVVMDYEHHRKISEQAFYSYVAESKLIINESNKINSLNEVVHFSLNGILYLLDFFKIKKALKVEFETSLPVNHWHVVGSIDCIVTGADGKISIIDFKRSAVAVGTKAETMTFKKIQIWVYLLIMKKANFEIDSFGYLNLSEPGDGKLIFHEDEAINLIDSTIERFTEHFETTMTKINSTQDFLDQPRETKVCHFCPVALFCLKGGILE